MYYISDVILYLPHLFILILLCFSENESRIPLDAEVRLIYGIVGVVRLLAGTVVSSVCVFSIVSENLTYLSETAVSIPICLQHVVTPSR